MSKQARPDSLPHTKGLSKSLIAYYACRQSQRLAEYSRSLVQRPHLGGLYVWYHSNGEKAKVEFVHNAKDARAKLQAALKQYERPRPEVFVKVSKAFRGEDIEDTELNKES